MPDDEEPFNNAFGALKERLAELPRGREPVAAKPKGPARAVVRLERKGRGGKEVTAVEQLGLGRAQLDEWLQALKSGLGCGGAVEGDTLVLQGDQRKRLPRLLEERGVRRVTVSGG
jgi:translation initiation factor 1